MRKRITAIFLAVCLCATLLPMTAMATSKTADDAINWVKSQVGHSVGYDDGSGYFQCVEFIQAYYEWLGVNKSYGNGCDYATNALPDGWTRTRGGTPQKGDILVYSAYSSTVQQYGHVAIYESDSVLYDQDGSVYGATVKKENKYYKTYTYNYWGCIHPNFASSAPSVSFKNWESDRTYVRETDASIGQEVIVSGGNFTKIGMILYDGNRTKLGEASDTPTAGIAKYYYKINEEMGVTLKQGTSYQYRFYAVVDGKTYYSDYKSFETKGHSHIYTAVVTKPTCTEKGYTTHTCACGESYKDNYVNALGHDYGEWVTTKERTCTEKGEWQRTCVRCGDTDTMEVSATGHSLWNGICTACGYVDPDEHEHLFSVKENVNATCTTDGYTIYICKCGYSYKACDEPAYGHHFSGPNCEYCGAKNPNYVEKTKAPSVSITTTASTGKIKLSWAKVTGAEKYEVYRSTDNKTFKKLGTTTKTSYTNTSATAGTKYYYKVRGLNCDGVGGSYSKVVSKICDLAQPVVTLSNVASSGKIKVSWAKITGASKYEVYRATSSSGTYKKLTSTTSTSYTDTSAKAGSKYYYKVKAICSKTSDANSAYSAVVYRVCDVARPTVKITTSKGDPKLTWAKIDGASKYEVYRATSKSGTYTKMTTTSKTSYTNTSAKAGKTYYYKVKAVCSKTTSGNSAYSSVVSIKAK